MGKRYKCPYCEERLEKEKLIDHVEDNHDDLIPEKETPAQVVFNHIHKKTHGTCVICKNPTLWNEKAGRYDRLCSDKCKETMRENFKTNSLSKHGKYNFTADPEFQEKMLKGRKISSTYTFSDGGKVDYVGSYEKKFLEFVDKVMNIESKDIIAPGPIIEYEFDGEIHHWITDFYYVPGNLVLDVKDGGKNPNTRPMEEYREKQLAKEAAIKKLRKYNYLRLTDNNFGQFIEVLADLKMMALDINEKKLINKINESAVKDHMPKQCTKCGSTNIGTFLHGEPIYKCKECGKYLGTVPFKESFIEELSAAMSTVPPVYSSDASVLISVDNTGDTRMTLSSLDFNDALLIDDEEEGIKKISKKEFKEKYTIKEQFKIPKDEKYFNLLESFKNKDICIYEGIYKNLSSFEYVISESQLYFDDRFTKVEEDKSIRTIRDLISEVNECVTVVNNESTLIRNDRLYPILLAASMLPESVNESINMDIIKEELDPARAGFFYITPSEDKEDLQAQYDKFNAQNDDQKYRADVKSLDLYGMTNYDHYHILVNRLKDDDTEDELMSYNRHDEELIVKEASELESLCTYFNCDEEELRQKIDSSIDFTNNNLGKFIIYPTKDSLTLETIYMKYINSSPNDRHIADTKAKELFGMDNMSIYNLIKRVATQDDKEDTYSVDTEVEDDSLNVNDAPLISPDEFTVEVDEDYSCFNDEDGKIIKEWRESYNLLGQGIYESKYRELNLKRLNILRKSIYENNIDGIIQCGWIPGVEFNSENRVKASNLLNEKLSVNRNNVISYEDIEESLITESSTSVNGKKAVSIVLVKGNSFLGKTIMKVQNNEFSHASISLDDDLKRIYSFNIKGDFNGLTYESIKGYINDGVEKIGVYTFLVTDEVYKSLENMIDKFALYIKNTKYSVLNLLTIPLNIHLDMDMKMVCSEFVDKLLKAANINMIDKPSALVSPKDFTEKVKNDTKIVEIFKDSPKKFNSTKIKKRIEKLKNSNHPIYEFAEYIEEAKSLPIQFDTDGNLIIKNIRRIDFEQEYANSHRLLMEYDKSKSYEPMKFELAKMHFLITLMEKKIYKKDEKELVKTRARYLNDFKKYLKIVNENDKSFNFSEYYEKSPFNDASIQIDNSTLKYGWKALKYMITK